MSCFYCMKDAETGNWVCYDARSTDWANFGKELPYDNEVFTDINDLANKAFHDLEMDVLGLLDANGVKPHWDLPPAPPPIKSYYQVAGGYVITDTAGQRHFCYTSDPKMVDAHYQKEHELDKIDKAEAARKKLTTSKAATGFMDLGIN